MLEKFIETVNDIFNKSTHLNEKQKFYLWLDIVKVGTDWIIQFDNEVLARDSIKEELDIFNAVSSVVDFSEGHPYGDILFHHWLKGTPNRFAKIYKLGVAHEAKRSGMRAARRATNGRRLIGATTRERVRTEAEKRMHLTKGAAAYEIGTAINLSPDRVRRLLSELYPGKSWAASPDLTSRNT